MGNDTTTTTSAQEKVAKTVSTIVLIGTCVFGALGISIAIVAMCKNEFTNAKDILQILFSAILPLFGTWIGTILAYYFSKENLAAANQTVQHLVNSITSDKKLEAIKAKDVMIPLDKLFYQPYKTGADDKNINLKSYFLDFITSKNIQRVILLDETNCAKYVLHKSSIEGFIAEQYFSLPTNTPPKAAPADPAEEQTTSSEGEKPATNSAEPGSSDTGTFKAARDLTFADLKANGNASVQAILKDGIKFIKEDANLSDAKLLINNYIACNDVFVTKNGMPNDPILGWITNKTITENSIV